MPSSLGPAEILVVLIVALVVLGPNRLPEAGRQIGRALAELRRWSTDLQDEVRRAVDPEPTFVDGTTATVAPSEPAEAAAPDAPPAPPSNGTPPSGA